MISRACQCLETEQHNYTITQEGFNECEPVEQVKETLRYWRISHVE